MANVFQPDLNPDIRYEQPVDNPSVLGGLFNAASNLIQDSGRAGSGTKKKTDDKNLALFSDQVGRIQKVREEKGEVAAAILERQLAANFAATGQEFDEDFKAVYETQTGRPWDYYSRDQETRLRQDVLFNDPLYQSGYMASYALPESANFSEEERIQFASQYVAEQKAAEVLLQRSMKNGQIQWSTGAAEAFSIKRKAVTDITWGLLSQAAQRGEVVSSEDFAKTRTEWESFKTAFGRPEGVTDDQWKSEQYARDQVDQAFSNMEKIIGSPELTRRMTETLQRLSIEEGMDPLLTLSIPEIDFQTMMTTSEDLRKDFFNLGKMAKNGMPKVRMSDITNTGKVGTGSPITVGDLPQPLQDVADQPPEQIWDSVLGSKTLMRGNEEALNRPEFRHQFVNGAVVMGTSLMHGNKDSFLSYDFIKSSIASPQFIANVNRLTAIDPTAGASVKAVMQSGINAEIVRQRAAIGQIEWQYNVKWDGYRYVFDAESYAAQHPNATPETIKGAEQVFNNRGLTRVEAGVDAGYAEAASMRQAVDALEKASGLLQGKEEVKTSNEVNTELSFNLPEAVRQDQPFVDAVVRTSEDLGFNPSWLFRAIEFETSNTWSPSITNPGSSATGLIQFMGSTARQLGTSTAALASMDRVQQMEYVAKYLSPYKGRIKNFGDLYMAIHYPVAVGKPDSFVLYSKGHEAYGPNINLDTNGDGTVTRGEAVARAIGATGSGKMSDVSTGRPLFLPSVDPQEILPPETSTPVLTFQSTRGSQGVTQGASPSAAATLPEDVVRQSTAAPVKSQTVVPEEVSNLVRSMVDRGVSEDEVLAEIERYLSERKKK